jgi:phosphoglycerate dehydrogenase-like enzyme
MRLLLTTALRPESIEQLRGISPTLDVVDVSADPTFDIDALDDPAVVAMFGRRAPADLTRVPNLRWLQVGSAGVDHIADNPPWERGIQVTNGRGVFAARVPRIGSATSS